MTQQLNEQKAGSRSTISLQTNDPDLQRILVEINRLLNEKQDLLKMYHQKEDMIKKMVTNISHDLRTPLTVVQGLVETLLKEDQVSVEDERRYLLKIQERTTQINTTIHHFFELAKLESQDVALPLQRLNLTPVCKQSILHFYHQIEVGQIELNLQLEDRPIYALAHEDALNRVLQNLISNALKYGQDGSFIGLQLREDADYIYIDVRDKGRGIPLEEQQHIFTRLYKTDDGQSGLGLTIARQLVAKMHGELSVKSEPFRETVFTIRLNKA
ncbi:sensor histidine kinase KdpD [Jeotgalibacillus sp. R-1-5s-1]|uniref:sensor histidine kinase n=1 Tax=Jeotgalibacillus sp. R-1-5s-1 TaxID=2555897 RepID=UPI00141A8664|nr:HAMP domain-containing sensor histidine kinase [Jeotgalibacillus sp. R-1-5s-1]